MSKRVIAIHLPQFYPFSENDEWWGKGFTEWRNVAKAKPRFRGHYQPHIPADLGFYDLRLKESRIAQQELAKKYGIYGFCYYHYWFNGHLLMEKPIEAMLADKDELFPFMLNWANPNWGRNWDSSRNEILISQNYTREDDIEHFNYLLPFFKDPRYIKIDGKPVIAIYSTDMMPDPEQTCKLWKELAIKNGFELYICRVEVHDTHGSQFITPSMDAAMEFQPFNLGKFRIRRNILSRVIGRIFHKEPNLLYSYKDFVNFECKRKLEMSYKLYPCVFPCWDNASRRIGQSFMAFKDSTPDLFKKWLKYTYNTFEPYSKDENLIFINAWNEWAEGCHLEPDLKYGRGYLEAVKEIVLRNESKS